MFPHDDVPLPDRPLYVALDFDGVLHPEGCNPNHEFALVSAFELAARTQIERGVDLRILITSMWRFNESLEVLRSHFSPDIAERIVGVTPDLAPRDKTEDQLELEAARWTPKRDEQLEQMKLDSIAGLRQREVEDWIRRNDPSAPWVAIDDRQHGFAPGCPNLVKTNSDRGLTVANIAQFHALVISMTQQRADRQPATQVSSARAMRL